MTDRIEKIYEAIDQMANEHGKPRHSFFGGGVWNFNEEIEIWKKQVILGEANSGIEPLTELQWTIIDAYINKKKKEVC